MAILKPLRARFENSTVLGAGLLLGACALLFRGVLFGGQTFFSRDVTPFFYPMKAFLARSVRAGEFPLWNPWVLNGEPFFASLQPGVLYPGSLLLYLLRMPFAFDLLIVVHFVFAGAGMWLFLAARGRSRAAAVLGALGFMLGGYFVSLANFPNNLQTVAWLPWLFLGWERVRRRASVSSVAGFGLLAALAFLGGEPQMLGLGLALILPHALVTGGTGETRRRQVGLFCAAGVAALALSAVQLLPFLEMIGRSVRTLDIDMTYAAFRSLEPVSLVHLAVRPGLDAGAYGFTAQHLPTTVIPWLLSIYPGLLVLGFAVVGTVVGEDRRRRAFWVATAVVGVLLALGRHGLLYRALFHALPILRPFRYPEKFFLLTAFALPVLAAAGLDAWLAGGPRPRRIALWTFGLTGLGLGAAAAILRLEPGLLAGACEGTLSGALLCADAATGQRIYANGALTGALLAGAALLVALLRQSGRGSRRGVVALLLALAATDLLVANGRVNPSVESDIYVRKPWAAEVLDRTGADPQAWRYRGSTLAAAMGSIVSVRGALELSNMYLDYQGLGPNLGQLYGHLTQDGLQGVELRSVSRTTEAALAGSDRYPVRLLRAMNVRWYADATAVADSARGLRVIARHPDLPIRIFEVPDPLPRAYLVSAFEIAKGPDEALRRALEPDFPLRESVVLEASPEARPAGGSRGVVRDARYGTSDVTLEVETDGPMLLVLLDRDYPGWTARVNDRPAAIARANGAFRAVVVPAGRSTVRFDFRPASVRIGAWISILSAAAIAIAVTASRRSRTG
ncbi:MAG: hypothetical protein ACE5HF_00165 [Gemmatimonadota bacterium]